MIGRPPKSPLEQQRYCLIPLWVWYHGVWKNGIVPREENTQLQYDHVPSSLRESCVVVVM